MFLFIIVGIALIIIGLFYFRLLYRYNKMLESCKYILERDEKLNQGGKEDVKKPNREKSD